MAKALRFERYCTTKVSPEAEVALSRTDKQATTSMVIFSAKRLKMVLSWK
jgi:hypothetical protein